MMAAGGLVAAVGLRSAGPADALPLGRLAVRCLRAWPGLGFLVLVEPRVFPRLSAVISIPFPDVGPEALPRFSHRLLGEGLLWSAAGWALLGLSQVGGHPGAGAGRLAADALAAGRSPSVALATVAGFAVAIAAGRPGGARVGPDGDAGAGRRRGDLAVVSALVLRLAWVVGEVLAAGAAVPSSVPPPAAGRAMISFVVPVFNEHESLADPPRRAGPGRRRPGRATVEIVFVDDGSRDGSWEVIARAGRRATRGSAASASAATSARRPPCPPASEAARGEIVMTLDADLQDDPAEIPRFLEQLGQAARRRQRLEADPARPLAQGRPEPGLQLDWSAG